MTSNSMKIFIKENPEYTEEQVLQLAKYCERTLFQDTCALCKIFKQCCKCDKYRQQKLGKGKTVGAFFLCDVLTE